MNVRVHAGLDQVYQVFRLVAPIFACLGVGLIAPWQTPETFWMVWVTGGLGFLAIVLAWYLLPVQCVRDGCPGRMRRTARRVSFWTVSAVYRCDDCETVLEVDVFNPNVQITYGDY